LLNGTVTQYVYIGAPFVAWSLRELTRFVCWSATTATIQTALPNGSGTAR